MVFDRLQVLVDTSLVHRVDDGGDEPRFGMLETVREYALARLAVAGEVDTVARRHLEWCLTLEAEANTDLDRGDARQGLHRLDRELDNISAALQWARATHNLELGLRLAVSLGDFCEARGHLREGREWLE